ncbi:NPC intracellular cholesterol transporter 2 [Hydra vulgaris]|uniref:NPC intracellular cholesterol transporter 2 n=1 Tax=Hydra vulgaris TaxID=6087 RepID=UPI000192790D|nr:NPC intracellular cholesterol transporter 2 [Hydra vulgaris]
MKILFGFMLIAVSQCMIIKYKPCDMSSTVGDVAISPCDKQPCAFQRGGSANIEISFTAAKDADKLTTVVKGKIGPIWVPFPLSQPDACNNEGLTCPIKSSQKYTYQYSLPISESYPKINLPVSWELKDEKGESLVCIIFPISLV